MFIHSSPHGFTTQNTKADKTIISYLGLLPWSVKMVLNRGRTVCVSGVRELSGFYFFTLLFILYCCKVVRFYHIFCIYFGAKP